MRQQRTACRLLAAVASTALAIAALAGCGATSRRACTPVPATIPEDRLIQPGQTLVVPVGALVYVPIFEPEEYTGPPFPSSFPWEPARVSDGSLLERSPACRRPTLSTLRGRITAFRARAIGTVRVVVPLAPVWRRTEDGPEPFTARVIVRR